MKITTLRAAALALLLAFGLAADTLILKTGERITGMYIGGDARTVRFIGPDRTPRDYSIIDVRAIEFGSSPATASAPAAPAALPVAPASPKAPAPASAAQTAASVVVPAGTEIIVRTIDSIDSKTTAIGERFRCSVDDPVVVGNQVVVPRGADCTVQVMRVKEGGRLTGSEELAIKLYNITLNGKAYDVAAGYAELKTKGEGKSTAKKTAVGAAAGAVIGAIAGGGRGAAIGAGIGGAGGVAASAIRGPRLYIPSETRLSFELRAPLAVE